ncbi:MAG: ABC transporter permease [Sphingobacteriales bacterium]|nr:MAG: ABC transporter permease [Sphingobacteriales bacterium]
MNFTYFISSRTSFQSNRSFSRVIIRIALLAVALSLAIMLISDAIVIGFQNEIKDKVTSFSSHIQVSKTKTNFSFENEPMPANDSFVRQVSAMNGVAHIQPFATKPGIIKTNEAIEGVVLKGVDNKFDWKAFSDKLLYGKPLSWDDSVPSTDIILSKYITDKLSLKIGDEVIMYFVQQPPRARKFTVTGIYQTSIEELDKVYMLVDIRHVQSLNGWDSATIGGYEVFLKDFDRLDEINEEVRIASEVTEDTKTIKERYPQIFDWLDLLNVNIEIIMTLMALVAAINMVTALIIMILERTRMIGVFKALGATDWTLQKIFIYNAMRLIGVGLLIGNALAFGLLLLQKHFHIMKLSQESYYVAQVPVHFNWNHILLINLGAFIFCTLAMLVPSLLVTRIRPVKAIRFE